MEQTNLALPKARIEGLLTSEMPDGDGIIVYDRDRRQAHHLNHTVGLVWQHCDGRTTFGALTELLRHELQLPPREELVWLALDHLEKAHLLQERPVPPETGEISRRAMIRKLGLAGALTALLPLVETIVVPTPAAAWSGSSSSGGDEDYESDDQKQYEHDHPQADDG